MKFSDTQLHPRIKEHLNSLNFTDCTPIQEKAIDPIIEGKDISGLAQTGTGKTAAFLLPLIHRFLRAKEISQEEMQSIKDAGKASDFFPDYNEKQFALILVPTRELAEQVLQAFEQFKGDEKLEAVATYGGVDIEAQKKKLEKGIDFLIATPGRLIDLYKNHHVDLKQVCAIVFDEADRMFDMGFKDDMVYLLHRIPKQRQFLVFSATLNFDVLTVAYQFESNPIDIQIDRDQPTAENINHKIFHIGQEDKPTYLLSLLKKEDPKQTIIFSNFRHQIEKVVSFLNKNEYPAMGISSLLNQQQRNRVLSQFKAENKNNIMVATDVAARGLDIKDVDLVINYELPDDAENYIHRIGRTGRAGEQGKAYSLVSDLDVPSLQRIETYLKEKIEVAWLDDEEIAKDFAPFPSISNNRRPNKSYEQRGKKGSSYKKDGPRKRSEGPRKKSESYSARKSESETLKPKKLDPKSVSNGSKRKNEVRKKGKKRVPQANKTFQPNMKRRPKQSKVGKILSKLKFWQ